MNPNLQNTQEKVALMQSNKKYNSARGWLLATVAFSFINIFMIYFADSFFYVSSYISQLLPIIGLTLKEETGSNTFLIVTGIISVVLLIPYVLCYIFSKKHYGWMIGALVLFSVDTLVLLCDLLSYIQTEFALTYIVNTVFHIYVLVTIAMAVKYGVEVKKRAVTVAETDQSTADTDEQFNEIFTEHRNVTVERAKSFVCCAVMLTICVDGNPVDNIKNGETKVVSVDTREHALTVITDMGQSSETLPIPAEIPCSYKLSIKYGPKIILTKA